MSVDYNIPTNKLAIDDLSIYFENKKKDTIKILPKEKRRYVIYIRKSTDDEEKQVRSLDDQRDECIWLANQMGIEVKKKDIFEESASAKKSGKRDVFDAMMHGFKTGKYHGLIAWSPDRLSRNMKEGGEIIEMIDDEYIQDLCFKTYNFDNSPNGKMMLGILFATSKQYSDKLSVDVSRGISGSVKDGKYLGNRKKGYYSDVDTHHFIPDGKYWELMRKAVEMRLNDGKTLKETADFLNEVQFKVRSTNSTEPTEKEKYIKYVFTEKNLGKTFEDPFYFGLYTHGKHMANLVDLYNFQPLMSTDEYVALNSRVSKDFGTKYVGRNAESQRLGYGLLREKIICGYCNTPMQFQRKELFRGKNTGRYVITYYCRKKKNGEEECERHTDKSIIKSVRARQVMAAIEWALRNCTVQSQEAYSMYIDKLKVSIAQDTAIEKRKLSASKKELKNYERHYGQYQDLQRDDPAAYKRHHKGKLEESENLISLARSKVKESEKKLAELGKNLPSKEEFFGLTDSYLLKLLNTESFVEQDQICNLLVSDLTFGPDDTPVINLNPPYDLMVDLTKVLTGRGERT